MSTCPCGSDDSYASCCEPYLRGHKRAATAEALMRSRYTAYTLNDEDYLLASWHHTTRPAQLGLSTDSPVKWIGLTIVETVNGSEEDHDGIIEFIAKYKDNGKAIRLQERSHFVKENGEWFYLRGDINQQ